MTLKATMTIEQYNELSPEPLMAALRAELGCHEPLCVLAVTAAPGSAALSAPTATAVAAVTAVTATAAAALTALTATAASPSTGCD